MSETDISDQPRRIYSLRKEILNDKPLRMSYSPSGDDSALPDRIDMRDRIKVIYDQGLIGSCVAHSICYCLQFLIPDIELSRLFLYYGIRVMESAITKDEGGTILSGVKVMSQTGCCKEKSWPYITENFAMCPPPECYEEDGLCRIAHYEYVNPSEIAIKSCLAAGHPISLGIEIYASFESKSVALTGRVPLPVLNEPLLGSHAVCAVGYRDDSREFILVNSWNRSWGDFGFFYLPYEYLTCGKYVSSNLFRIDLMRAPDLSPTQNPVPLPTPPPIVPIVNPTPPRPNVIVNPIPHIPQPYIPDIRPIPRTYDEEQEVAAVSSCFFFLCSSSVGGQNNRSMKPKPKTTNNRFVSARQKRYGADQA
jgi:hypothetical protein